ncbi:MAG: virulence-associated e family protein [Bacteroidetes bacterium]|nr:virulence-associated e family protein [Bacteroidota bacterium]
MDTNQTTQRTETESILHVLKLRFQVRYNTRTNEFEVLDRRYARKGWRTRNSRIDNSIFLHLKNLISDRPVNKQDVDILFTSEVEEYNDIHQYFQSISWDKSEKDYILELANTVQCIDQEYWIKEFRNWLVLMVGTMLNTEEDISNGTTIVNSTILTFIGKGGIGKTYWFNKLLPPVLRKYLKNGLTDIRHKDANIALSRYALIKIDEIDTLSKQEKEKLAKMVTDYSIEERLAYERYDSKLVRIASFCATTNNDDFLLSGAQSNRRYSIHVVKSLNAEHGIDLDKVFAQAYYLFTTGQYVNSQEYHKQRYDLVKEYEQTDLDFEILCTHFVECDESNTENWLSASEVYHQLRSKGYTLSKDSTSSIGRLLTRLLKDTKNKKKSNGVVKYNIRFVNK